MCNGFSKFNELFYKKNLQAFWRYVKRSRRHPVLNTVLKVESLAEYYANIMTDNDSSLHTDEQKEVVSTVNNFYNLLSDKGVKNTVMCHKSVSDFIDKLNYNCSPGIDKITGEHLKHGKTETLCKVLSNLFSCILSWKTVPSVFKVGVIVPILKKPSLNPSDASSYRPVTLSSVFSKILEMIMLPSDNVSDSQFGFRKGRGTSLACSLYNDVKCYFQYVNSPLLTCSLDAEKCFDSIWHNALFYKLKDKIPNDHWLILYRWYKGLKATVRWNNVYSDYFDVTRGTRQGSVLSPQLFNIFINDLLIQLDTCTDKVAIGNCSLNSFAYADDVNLLCTTVPELQRLINICTDYADKWRFRFGINKTKCLVIAGNQLADVPKWNLKGQPIVNVDSLEILGVHYDSKNVAHVDNRIAKCKRVYHSLKNVGLSYPGCDANVKAYLWNSICQPVLLHGMDSVYLPHRVMEQLESTQGTLIKQCLGLSKRSRSSNVLQALHIRKVQEKIKQSTASLLKHSFIVQSPMKDLTSYFLSLYICKGVLIPGTLVERAVSFGLSPIRCLFNDYKMSAFSNNCGIVDSIRALIMHENFIKPYSEQHVLTSLLTKSF